MPEFPRRPSAPPRKDSTARLLYSLAGALGVASVAIAGWGWVVAKRYEDQLTRAARVQAELLARDFAEEVRIAGERATGQVFGELIYDPDIGNERAPQRVLDALKHLKECDCGPKLRATGGAFWWSSVAPGRLVTVGMDSARIKPLLDRIVVAKPRGDTDAVGAFILKVDASGHEVFAPIAYAVRNRRIDAIGYLGDATVYAEEVMRPVIRTVRATRFGEAGTQIDAWRVIRPGGDTVLSIGDFDAEAPRVTLDFFRPRVQVNNGVGLSFLAPPVEPPPLGVDSLPPDPSTTPFRIVVQVDPSAVGEFLYGSRQGPTLAVLILLAVSLVLTWATLQLARRFVHHVREREAFATAVAHDLRTPLTQILLYGESLQLDRPAVRSREEAARIIVRETRRLIHLVENALHFVRGERARPSLRLEPVDIEAVVSESINALQPVLDRSGVSVALQLEPVTVLGDRNAIVQVLTNLVDNAVRFGPPNQTIVVRLHREGSRAVLDIDDGGPGIPEHLREVVFRPFVRAGVSQGTGIGLAVSRQLAELMDGTLTAHSAPSGGARLRLTIACAPAASRAESPTPQPVA